MNLPNNPPHNRINLRARAAGHAPSRGFGVIFFLCYSRPPVKVDSGRFARMKYGSRGGTLTFARDPAKPAKDLSQPTRMAPWFSPVTHHEFDKIRQN